MLMSLSKLVEAMKQNSFKCFQILRYEVLQKCPQPCWTLLMHSPGAGGSLQGGSKLLASSTVTGVSGCEGGQWQKALLWAAAG